MGPSIRIAVFALLLVVIAAQPFARAGDEAGAYDPAQFTIGYWCGPPAKFTTLDRYKEVKDAGFTVAFPPCSGATVETNQKILDFCQQLGMKAIIADPRMVTAIGGSAANQAKLDAIIKDYSSHPALLGYFIADEPGAGAFPGLAEVVSYLKQKDPKHPGYINLLPTYGRDFNVLGTKTYEEYVSRFAHIVKPFVLSWDHYHFTVNGDRPDYFENLATVRKISLETHIPFWQIVLAVQHFAYQNETAAQLRYDAMQTLAFGGRGLMWFTYWSPADSDKSAVWQHAMINADGSKDPHYDMIRQVNADVKAIGDALGKATSIAVYQPTTKPTTKATTDKAAGKSKNAGVARADGSQDSILPADAPLRVTNQQLTVGLFRGASGNHFALLANRDYKHPANTRVARTDGGPLEIFDPANGKWSRADAAQPLAAGGGILLRW